MLVQINHFIFNSQWLPYIAPAPSTRSIEHTTSLQARLSLLLSLSTDGVQLSKAGLRSAGRATAFSPACIGRYGLQACTSQDHWPPSLFVPEASRGVAIYGLMHAPARTIGHLLIFLRGIGASQQTILIAQRPGFFFFDNGLKARPLHQSESPLHFVWKTFKQQ